MLKYLFGDDESRSDSSPSAACKHHSQRSARGQCRTSVPRDSTSMKASFEGGGKKREKKWRGEKKKGACDEALALIQLPTLGRHRSQWIPSQN